MTGRYSDFAEPEIDIAGFSVSGSIRSGLGDVYEVDFSKSLPTAGSFTITLRFGPQGRNFDSVLSIEGGVEAELEDIGITLGGVQFSGETVMAQTSPAAH